MILWSVLIAIGVILLLASGFLLMKNVMISAGIVLGVFGMIVVLLLVSVLCFSYVQRRQSLNSEYRRLSLSEEEPEEEGEGFSPFSSNKGGGKSSPNECKGSPNGEWPRAVERVVSK